MLVACGFASCAPAEREIERAFHIGRDQPGRRWDEFVFPRGTGPFVRRAADDAGYSRELAAGRWDLISWFAKTLDIKYGTNNARSEELADKATYEQPWARGQRCIIPAHLFDEPCWETGKNVWWRFRPANDELWGLAGLWSTRTDRATGEIHESDTMLTINADDHPLMRRMDKPKPNRPADQQDKRSVIPLAPQDWDTWLAGTGQQAQDLFRLPVSTRLDAAGTGDAQRRGRIEFQTPRGDQLAALTTPAMLALVPALEGQLEADTFMLRPTADGVVHRLLLECVHSRQTPHLALIPFYRLRARLSVLQPSIQLGSRLFQQGLELGKIVGVGRGH